MTFTKKQIAAAVGGAFVAAVGSQAVFAATDIDGTANAGINVASESVLTTSSAIQPGGEDFGIAGTISANNIPASTDVRVTVTLSGYTFAGAPTLTLADAAYSTANSTSTYVDSSGNAASPPTFAVFTGGGTADSTVTFNTNTGDGEIVGGAHFLFNLNAAGLATGGAQSNITADVSIAIADNFGPTDLAGFSAEPYINWTPIASLSADATNTDSVSIDVAQDSLYFSGGATGDNDMIVGGWRINENTASAPVSIAGAAVNVNDITTVAQGTVVAGNGFSAFNQGTVGGSVGFAGSTSACTITTSDANSAVCATYTPAATGDAAGANDITVTAPTANTVRIAETTLVANVSATAANTAAFSTSTVTGAVNLASLARNGSSARLNFALTPEGNYPMFIRVTNPSAVSGPVTLTLTNDDGTTSAGIDISTISGGPSGDLVAGASTGLLNINDVYTAVQAADATFELGATDKLRVDVVAEFGGSGAGQGVVLSSFNLSTDGTSFNMMTDASN